MAKCCKPICNGSCFCYLSVFEIGMLVFMQVTYFTAQDNYCMSNAPDLYFWMMGQILVQYVGLAFVLCYFLRKLDDSDDDDFEAVDEEKSPSK